MLEHTFPIFKRMTSERKDCPPRPRFYPTGEAESTELYQYYLLAWPPEVLQ